MFTPEERRHCYGIRNVLARIPWLDPAIAAVLYARYNNPDAVVKLINSIFRRRGRRGGQARRERRRLAENREQSREMAGNGSGESCRGCSLNRLPDVKNFIYGDLSKYSGVEFHPIPGAVPHLVLFDKSDKELLRKDLSSLSRKECNELVNKWFKLKGEEEEEQIEVPAVVKEVKEEL